ncbi:hypothetical protein LLT1_14400 [Lactococcus cremoris subsp. cremoris TIFN1]|nr:hypothetical protein LLT1_14400 [Lactococcus cremoris subsp. cremoris TIFN1]
MAKMDKVPLKIFELAVSLIDTDNPPKTIPFIFLKPNSLLFLKWTTAINTVVLKKP